MKRREVLILSLGVATACVAAETRPRGLRDPFRVGVLNPGLSDPKAVAPLFAALRELGYLPGGNLVVEVRHADGRPERLLPLATELVEARVDAILAFGTLGPIAARKATTSIPIIMVGSGDPVRSGLVANLARPGGNVTGVSINSTDLAAKRLQLLRRILPEAKDVAVMWNSANPYAGVVWRETSEAAKPLALRAVPIEVAAPSDFPGAYANVARLKPHALLVIEDPLTLSQRKQIGEFARGLRLPVISGLKEFADEGALMTYGANVPSLLRNAAGFLDRILKGVPAEELPIEQPTQYEMTINRRAADFLGVSLPTALLLAADVVIE